METINHRLTGIEKVSLPTEDPQAVPAEAFQRRCNCGVEFLSVLPESRKGANEALLRVKETSEDYRNHNLNRDGHHVFWWN